MAQEADALLALALEADNSEVPDGMDIPKELKRWQTRLALIKEAMQEIEERAEVRYEQEV